MKRLTKKKKQNQLNRRFFILFQSANNKLHPSQHLVSSETDGLVKPQFCPFFLYVTLCFNTDKLTVKLFSLKYFSVSVEFLRCAETNSDFICTAAFLQVRAKIKVLYR